MRSLWVQFVGVILALSGAESIANMTGVMKLDPGSTMDHPKVSRTSLKAILPVAIEVVGGTALLGWAMLSLPSILPQTLHLTTGAQMGDAMGARNEDMLRFMGEQFGAATFSPWFGVLFGWIVGIVFFFLLVSAANTAIVAMIGLLFMMARDGEMPRQFTKLNKHGVPIYPLLIAVGIPSLVLLTATGFTALAGLYAIGVVGAIAVNVGSCSYNKHAGFTWYDRVLFGVTFLILFLVELTLAHSKPDALFFVTCVLLGGLALRAYTLKRQGLTTLTSRGRSPISSRRRRSRRFNRGSKKEPKSGRGARGDAGFELCAGRSGTAQGGALRFICERDCRLFRGRTFDRRERQVAGRPDRPGDHVIHDEAGQGTRHLCAPRLRRE